MAVDILSQAKEETQARDWVFSARPGIWAGALARREARMLGDLEDLAGRLREAGWDWTEKFSLRDCLRRFIASEHPRKTGLILHPSFDGWLKQTAALMRTSRPNAPALKGRVLEFLGFSAALALEAGETLEGAALLDLSGHFHCHGLPVFRDFGAAAAGRRIDWRAENGNLSIRGAQGESRRLPMILDRIEINDCDPLIIHPFVDHSSAYRHEVAHLPAPESTAYAAVLERALEQISALDKAQFEEIVSDIRVAVPLENPSNLTSVSSTYDTLHGAIGLSHSEDVIIQAETLIHEFSHNKLNLLMETNPLFADSAPSQARFYSPWRKDPRPLRGLLLGAHAFLNTSRFTLAALRSMVPLQDAEGERRLMGDALKTLMRVTGALRSLSRHGSYTPLGRRILLAMAKELAVLNEAAASIPADIRTEAEDAVTDHKRLYDPQ